MHITLESDYADRIVACLASENKRIDAKTISQKNNVSLRFALKILRKLVESGIVKSYKGTQGGYELAKSPSEISLCDVIETVEGTYHFRFFLAAEKNISVQGRNYGCTRWKTSFLQKCWITKLRMCSIQIHIVTSCSSFFLVSVYPKKSLYSVIFATE